jgi:hypothetical protein
VEGVEYRPESAQGLDQFLGVGVGAGVDCFDLHERPAPQRIRDLRQGRELHDPTIGGHLVGNTVDPFAPAVKDLAGALPREEERPTLQMGQGNHSNSSAVTTPKLPPPPRRPRTSRAGLDALQQVRPEEDDALERAERKRPMPGQLWCDLQAVLDGKAHDFGNLRLAPRQGDRVRALVDRGVERTAGRVPSLVPRQNEAVDGKWRDLLALGGVLHLSPLGVGHRRSTPAELPVENR